jgi:hypothetical protein
MYFPDKLSFSREKHRWRSRPISFIGYSRETERSNQTVLLSKFIEISSQLKDRNGFNANRTKYFLGKSLKINLKRKAISKRRLLLKYDKTNQNFIKIRWIYQEYFRNSFKGTNENL